MENVIFFTLVTEFLQNSYR